MLETAAAIACCRRRAIGRRSVSMRDTHVSHAVLRVACVGL
jgi:hypothetical protein